MTYSLEENPVLHYHKVELIYFQILSRNKTPYTLNLITYYLGVFFCPDLFVCLSHPVQTEPQYIPVYPPYNLNEY